MWRLFTLNWIIQTFYKPLCIKFYWVYFFANNFFLFVFVFSLLFFSNTRRMGKCVIWMLFALTFQQGLGFWNTAEFIRVGYHKQWFGLSWVEFLCRNIQVIPMGNVCNESSKCISYGSLISSRKRFSSFHTRKNLSWEFSHKPST